jgi:hypothetical protein
MKQTGELLWARSWSAGEGGSLTELGKDGSLLMEDGNGHVWVRPDGTERHLPPGFVPFHTPDADGWFGGVFSDRQTGSVSGYGFQHAETDARRALASDTRSAALQVGRPELIDGRFYYALVDASGGATVAVEGADFAMNLPLEGETELPELLPGPTHTLISLASRPLALLERATLELARLDAPPPDTRDLYPRVDGEWFVAFVQPGFSAADPSHPFHVAPLERAYRVHAPTARVDTTPLPALPDGLMRYEYTSCTWVTAGSSVDGQLAQPLAAPDVVEPAPVRLHVESDDGQGWEPLGEPFIFGTDARADRVGDSWLLRTGDARNRYCAERPTSEPGIPLPDALAGVTVQVVAPDGQSFGFGGRADQVEVLERDVSLSVDGNCALITGEGEARIHDLRTHDEQDLDLAGAVWLYPFLAGPTGW